MGIGDWCWPNDRPLKIDIGCGNRPKPGFMGIDILHGTRVNCVCDVTKGLPFINNEISEVYSDHFFEHLSIEEVGALMQEIHRVCKPNSLVEIRVPHFSGFTNFYEFHKTSWRHNSFAEYEWMQGMYDSPFRFNRLSSKICLVNRQSPKNHRVTKYFIWNYPMEWLVNKMPLVYETTGWRNIFPAWELIFKLKVIK